MSEREDFNARLRREAEEQFNLSYLDEAKLWLAWRVLKRKVLPKMLTLLYKFLWDETCFIRYARASLYLLFVAVSQGMIPALSGSKTGWWIAQFLPVIALMIGAGDKNRSPEEIKGIAQDLAIVPQPPKNGK